MKIKILILTVLFFSLVTKQGTGIENKKPFNAKRIYITEPLCGEKPQIDGALNDPCWLEQGHWASGFRQFMPDNFSAPTRQTKFKILYDEEYIYAAFRCPDDPDSIEIQAGRRDVMKGDIIGIAFDSYHDLRTAVEFDITSGGAKTDLSMIGNNFLYNWDAVWDGKVAFEDSAWTAEMRIPFSQLRFHDKPEHVWGLHVWRWIDRNKEESQWNAFHIDATSWPDNFGELHGIRNLKKKRRIELLPYTLTSTHIYPREAGNPFADGTDWGYNMGLDGKIGLSSNFTLDLTVNPDFGQVEADPSVLNLTAFETFYNEKRPFFLEGKSIFDFSINGDQLFYSRRIGQRPQYSPVHDNDEHADVPDETTILNALKITGKTDGGMSVGVIQSVTAAEEAEIDRSGERNSMTVEPWSNYFLTRIMQDYNRGNSALGAMLTSTQRFIDKNDIHLNFQSTQAFTGGLDMLHRWKNRSYFIEIKTLFSHIKGETEAITTLQRDPRHFFQRTDIDHTSLDTTRTSLSGFGGSIYAGKNSGGHWHYTGRLTWYSPGLDLNDLGYMRMADMIDQTGVVSYHENKPNNIYRNYAVYLSQQSVWDFGGRLTQTGYNLSANITTKNNWFIKSTISRTPYRMDTRVLRGGPGLRMDGHLEWSLYLRTDSRKKVHYSLDGLFNRVDDDASSQFSITPSLTWRIGTRFNFSGTLSYFHNIDDRHYIETIDYQDESRYILGRIDQDTWFFTLRADYAFTPDLILQYYVSPFISSGKYTRLKTVRDHDAQASDRRYHIFTDEEIIEEHGNSRITFDENSDGSPDYSIQNPDFNFREIRSNLVLRWEYKPGSTFYFVWTHGRSSFANESVRSLGQNAENLFHLKAQNIFMMKLNYWFSI